MLNFWNSFFLCIILCIIPLLLHAKEDFFIQQIRADLQPFQKLSKKKLDRAETYLKHAYNSVRVQFGQFGIHMKVLNKIEWQYRKKSVTKALNELLQFCKERNLKIPEVDFFLSLEDTFRYKSQVPVLTFAKDTKIQNSSVLFPDCDIFIGWYQMERLLVRKGDAKYPWKTKKEKFIWRGTTNGHIGNNNNIWIKPNNYDCFSRVKLVKFSIQHPEIVDARFIARSLGAEKIPEFQVFMGKRIPFEDFLAYKYQLLMDGTTYAFSRAYWQFLSNSVVFKEESTHVQWYCKGLLPFVHYIPIKSDLSDLIEKFQWVKTHDQEAQQIAIEATKFVHEHLSRDKTLEYMYTLFIEYEKLFQKNTKRSSKD